MSHGYFEILFSREHFRAPFTCPCDQNRLPGPNHSLDTWQKVLSVAIAFFAGLATFGLVAIPVFYMVTAAFKARNAVWDIYLRQCPDRGGVVIINPNWWGIQRPVVIQPQYPPGYQQPFRQPAGPLYPQRNHVLPPGTPRRYNHPNPYAGANVPVGIRR